MKKLPLTAIILLCFFLSFRAQKPAETGKSAPAEQIIATRYEEKLHITDLQFTAQVSAADHFQSGLLKTRVVLNRRPDSPVVAVMTLQGGPQLITRELSITDSLSELEIPVPKPLLWSAESPLLYTLMVTLRGKEANAAEGFSRFVSFRQVQLKDGFVWVNGRRIWIKGINLVGLARSRELVSGDIRLMKGCHINAVRASHSPGNAYSHADEEYLYQLCDQYGLYVLKDTNSASAGLTQAESQLTRQGQDHPCLIPGSAGIVEIEPVSGNSLGGFADTWDTIRAHRANLQGAYGGNFTGPAGIFNEQGKPLPASAELKKAYQDILTRLVSPLPHSLSVKAGKPVSAVKAPVVREAPAGVVIRVTNDYFFKDLSNVELEWELLVNGVTGSKGTIAELAISPQQSRDFRLPVKTSAGPGNELFLNIRYRLKKRESPLPAGYLLAEEQLMLKEANTVELSVTPKGELSFKDEDGAFSISCPAAGVDLRFNKQTGWLQQYQVKGVPLLDDTLGLTTNFWRAPTDGDYAAGLPGQLAVWKHSTKEPRLQLFSTSTSSELVIVRADYTLPEVFSHLHIRYTINARGELLAEQELELDTTRNAPGREEKDSIEVKGPPMLPRYGMQWILPAGYDSIVYYGCGPQENYADRNRSAAIGIYGQTVGDQFFPYARPQETGTKTNIRWWKIMNPQGKGLLITADSSLLSMSALHYFDGDLDSGDGSQQGNAGELTPRPQTQLSIDYRQMGIGGIVPRGSGAQPSCILPYENYHLTYKISPIP